MRRLVLLCLTGLSLADNNQHRLNDILLSGDFEFIDLSHPFDNKTIYWPGVQKFVFTKKDESFRPDGSWYAAKEFAAGEHGGTHFDAPYHFAEHGAYVADIPVEKLIIPLVVVDMSGIVGDNPHYVLFKNHLSYKLNHNMDRPCVMIIRFGWSKFFGNRTKYLGIDETRNTLNFPGLSGEVTEWIFNTYKNVIGIGVDTASVDPGSSTDFAAHKIITAKGHYILENVNLFRKLPEYGCTGLVMPMKIAEGTGAPCRLIAICPKVVAAEDEGVL